MCTQCHAKKSKHRHPHSVSYSSQCPISSKLKSSTHVFTFNCMQCARPFVVFVCRVFIVPIPIVKVHSILFVRCARVRVCVTYMGHIRIHRKRNRNGNWRMDGKTNGVRGVYYWNPFSHCTLSAKYRHVCVSLCTFSIYILLWKFSNTLRRNVGWHEQMPGPSRGSAAFPVATHTVKIIEFWWASFIFMVRLFYHFCVLIALISTLDSALARSFSVPFRRTQLLSLCLACCCYV